MSDLALKCADNLQKIRQNKPLIHNITNYVVMNYTANVLLA
ncbi:MAG: hydroxyethylthiazole kinase, partial [Desulfofustis sp.]|nr:hydroxyethylthiazole kinase [Desulfofustis sp.]